MSAYPKYLWQLMSGYKTYFVAGSTILYAIFYYGVSLHQYGNAVDLMLGASGLGALRHGVAKKQ